MFFCFGLFGSHLLWIFCLPSFHICTDDAKYCKHGIDLLLLCDIGVLQLIIFQVKEFHEVRICSLQVIWGRFLLGVCCFKLFFARPRLFQVISGRFLLVVGFSSHFLLIVVHFWLFVAHCRSFQVVSCLL